ncbi:hypothetical protein NP493_190g01013 [Ridgeia piscesae]|uniref:Uncharacterized protein n=1 Tax=Ridgeia piscesae TaxID=27915 RepID=A0AAD9UEV2_RIDPI|nr:hypothetical protein NP493_190g01013 [Ridgeia piscesae]
MATGSVDHTIKIWRLADGVCLKTLIGHGRGVWCLRFVTDILLLSGSYDCNIKVWNLQKGRCIRTLLSHEGPVWALVCRHNIFTSASQDHTAKVWDVSRSRLLHTLTGHTAAVFAVDMSDSGALVITGSADRSVRLWSAGSGEQKKVIWASQSTSIMAVSYSRGYFACSYGSTVSLYQLHHDRPTVHIHTYQEHKKRVETLELLVRGTHPLEGTLITAGQDGVLKCWGLNT